MKIQPQKIAPVGAQINSGENGSGSPQNAQAHQTAEGAARIHGEAAESQRTPAQTAGGSSGAASGSGFVSQREADPSEVVILPVWNDDKPFFCAGSTDLASIGSLFIQYSPNWEDKVRQFLVQAQNDGFIEEDDQDIRFRPVRFPSFSDTLA